MQGKIDLENPLPKGAIATAAQESHAAQLELKSRSLQDAPPKLAALPAEPSERHGQHRHRAVKTNPNCAKKTPLPFV